MGCYRVLWEFRLGGQRRVFLVQRRDNVGDVFGRRYRRFGGREEYSVREELKEDEMFRIQRVRKSDEAQRSGRVGRLGFKGFRGYC